MFCLSLRRSKHCEMKRFRSATCNALLGICSCYIDAFPPATSGRQLWPTPGHTTRVAPRYRHSLPENTMPLQEETPEDYTITKGIEKAQDDEIFSFQSPIFPNKTRVEETFIHTSLQTNFLFQDLVGSDISSLSQVVAAFEKAEYPSGALLCEQGDPNADFVHIICQGSCSVSIDGIQLPEPYGTMSQGSLVGDLAMLYDNPRAATVAAVTPVTVFRLDRASFQYFLETKAGPETQAQIQNEVRKIDQVIDKISGVQSKYGGDIIRPFQPMRSWLWRRWRGTVLQHAWKAAMLNMALSLFFIWTLRHQAAISWSVGMIPNPAHPTVARLLGLAKLWHYLMNITTFILTFFLSQAYVLWRDVYTAGRKIQGRMNDIGLLLATTAQRSNKTGNYTPASQQLLEDVAADMRVFHALMWAGFAKKLKILVTARGMSRMLSRGAMTRKQYTILTSLRPNGGPHNVCLMWILMRSIRGMNDGIIPDDIAIRNTLYSKLLELRGTQAGIGDLLDGRIPLAYAHFVQILVDAFLILAPFALYAELGAWSVPAVGLLTLFYSGLLDLAKILLDPLDNDEFYNDSVNMDLGVLIRESNAGSTRWMAGVETLPF